MKRNVNNRFGFQVYRFLQIKQLGQLLIQLQKLKLRQKIGLILGFIFSFWLLHNAINLIIAASKPVDAIMMLGGSIQREIHIAQQVHLLSNIPILISQGSQDPCIHLIFARENAPMENVWLEKCSKSTFENFVYGLPILKDWGAKKVKLVTSGSHVLRAEWMGRIIFGSHGIWVEMEVVPETGRPGNHESPLKTTLDLGRSVVWAGFSHIFQPGCNNVIKLENVDINQWPKGSFACERQGNLKY